MTKTEIIGEINSRMDTLTADKLDMMQIGLEALKDGRDPYEALNGKVPEEVYRRAIAYRDSLSN